MKKWMYNTLIIIFAAVFLCSAGALGLYFWQSGSEQSRYEELAQLRPPVHRTDPTEGSGEDIPDPTEPETVTVTDPRTGQPLTIQAGFEELFSLNSDIIGWLSIPAIGVDYPVMHTPDDPEYYLKRNFDRKKQSRGCLFAQGDADVLAPSDNVTVYGHRMRDGSMFGKLNKFEKKAFRQENPYIYFDCLTENRTYEILAVFRTTASVGEGFAYHSYVDMDEEEFQEYVQTVKDLALYDTGVDAVYGDKLLTLSTCEYSQTNGRLVVVAKLVTPQSPAPTVD